MPDVFVTLRRGGLAIAGEVAVQVDDVGWSRVWYAAKCGWSFAIPVSTTAHTMSSPKALNERRAASALTVTQEAST